MSIVDVEHDWIVTLDGSRVQVRRIETDDYDAVIQLALSLTDRERYLRGSPIGPQRLRPDPRRCQSSSRTSGTTAVSPRYCWHSWE
jgi:hypothetical protein